MPKKKQKKKNDLGMREKLPEVDVACETCTVDGCRRWAQGSHCTKWEHPQRQESREWTIVVKGRPLTEEEKQKHHELWLKNNINTIRRRGGWF